jgi:hypothetical protein
MYKFCFVYWWVHFFSSAMAESKKRKEGEAEPRVLPDAFYEPKTDSSPCVVIVSSCTTNTGREYPYEQFALMLSGDTALAKTLRKHASKSRFFATILTCTDETEDYAAINVDLSQVLDTKRINKLFLGIDEEGDVAWDLLSVEQLFKRFMLRLDNDAGKKILTYDNKKGENISSVLEVLEPFVVGYVSHTHECF